MVAFWLRWRTIKCDLDSHEDYSMFNDLCHSLQPEWPKGKLLGDPVHKSLQYVVTDFNGQSLPVGPYETMYQKTVLKVGRYRYDSELLTMGCAVVFCLDSVVFSRVELLSDS